MQYVMVFDVESVGLFGDHFAVGGVVHSLMLKERPEKHSFLFWCDPKKAQGTDESREWVKNNVVIEATSRSCKSYSQFLSPGEVGSAFWQTWTHWKHYQTILCADVPWPVEANFLLKCMNTYREKDSPYPILDVASIRLAAGLDPLATEQRRPNELPVHNPLADARQSARLLLETLDLLPQAKTWLTKSNQ